MSRVLCVFGPRRSGTNYLSDLLALNTEKSQFLIANLDKNPSALVKQSNRNINLHHILGSKHRFSDVPIEQKLKPDNINLVVVRTDLAVWINSVSRYIKTFDRSFEVNESTIGSLIDEYRSYLVALMTSSKTSFKLVFYEQISHLLLKNIAANFSFELNDKFKDINYKAMPGGGRAPWWKFRTKKLKYSKQSLESKICFDLTGRLPYDNVSFEESFNLLSISYDFKNIIIARS